jgi:hypothetical protein
MILPLPSSPHWAPTKIVFAIFFQGGTGFQPVSVLFDRQDACPTATKIPEREFGAKRASLRWEARDGKERCQFRRNNFRDENGFGDAQLP